MEKSTLINYICEHATVQETITRNTYCVRFPNPHSAKLFTSNDVESLVERVWEFSQTNDGRKMIEGLDFSAYTDENYNPEEESE